MARKEKKEERRVRIRDNQSPTLLRGIPVIPTSGFTFGRRFIAYFFSGLAATDVWCVTAHYPFIFQSQSVSTRVKVQCLPWLDTSYTPLQMRLQVFVCSDSLQIKVLPSLLPLPLALTHSLAIPLFARPSPAPQPPLGPTIRARSFLLSYFPAPRQRTIQGKERGQIFLAEQRKEANMWKCNFEWEKV